MTAVVSPSRNTCHENNGHGRDTAAVRLAVLRMMFMRIVENGHTAAGDVRSHAQLFDILRSIFTAISIVVDAWSTTTTNRLFVMYA